MKGNDGIKKIFIIELLLFISWCVVVLVFADYDRAGFYFWGGIGFGFLSYIVSAASLFFIKINNNRSTTEINYIPVYYTALYLIGTVIINTYFVFRTEGKFNVILVVTNLALLIAFVALRLYTDDLVSRVNQQTLHSAEKIRPITLISAQMATLLSIATDPDIKQQVLKLKETVDFSSNVSQGFTEESQNLFLLQLKQIEGSIAKHENKDVIGKRIQDATVVWNTRNSVASTIK